MGNEGRRLALVMLAAGMLRFGGPAESAPGASHVATVQGQSGAASARPLPRLVFVRRGVLADDRIPGLGPSGRTLAPGGRLEVREQDGRVHPLLDSLWQDVSDPCASWDGRTIAFAALDRARPGSVPAWRLWSVGADGRGLRPLTKSDRTLDLAPLGAAAARFERYDDFDPCWLPDGRLCFASTRFPQLAEQGGPATNLYVVGADGRGLRRITAERNGAEEPTVDPRSGRIVYARWWFNRYRASDLDSSGLTLDVARAVPADSIDLWHAVTVRPDGRGLRLAGGDPRTRASQMAYQPLMLTDGTLIGVGAEHRSLTGDPGHTVIRAFPGGFAAARPLTPPGARACSPAVLPDGRIVLSMDAKGSGRFALFVVDRDGGGLTRIAADSHASLLDAAPLVARRRPPVLASGPPEDLPALPLERGSALGEQGRTFRFDCLNVFANAPVDAPFPDVPAMERGVKIRFFAALARPDREGRDTVVLVRERALTPSGAVHVEDLPADTPLFEQLIDAHGHVLRSAGGPAHVPGMNFARIGSGTQCVGCHAGHSAITVPMSAVEGEWTNAAPSAVVSASSVAAMCPGVRAVVDRRAKGHIGSVAWVADSLEGQWIRLDWRWPIEVREVVLYACGVNLPQGTDLRVARSRIELIRDGRAVRQIDVTQPLAPSGTRIAFGPERIDGLVVRLLSVKGSVLHRPVAALAEIEAIGRLAAP